MKPTDRKIKVTLNRHHEFTFNGVTQKTSMDGRKTVYVVEDTLDTFTIESVKEKINDDQAMLYFAVSMLNLDPQKGNCFELQSDGTNNLGFSVYQRDGILESERLSYNHKATNDICETLNIPKKQGTNEYVFDNSTRVKVAVYALEKAFRIYDNEPEQNDIIAVVEQVANTDLVVTTFEELPSAEKMVVGVDYSKDAADATAYAMHNAEVQKKQPPKDDYQELLDNIENTIDVVSNDKLPYHERAKANRVLSVYFDRLNKYVHDTHVENIKAENKADKEYYRLYYAFLEDPKNVADNGKKPSDASAKAYATNATLDLYLDAKLSEALLKYLQSRLRSLNSIFEGVRQEVSNDKKIEEQSKIQK